MNICRTERKVSCMAYVTRKIISSYANDSILLLWRPEHLTSIYPWTKRSLAQRHTAVQSFASSANQHTALVYPLPATQLKTLLAKQQRTTAHLERPFTVHRTKCSVIVGWKPCPKHTPGDGYASLCIDDAVGLRNTWFRSPHSPVNTVLLPSIFHTCAPVPCVGEAAKVLYATVTHNHRRRCVCRCGCGCSTHSQYTCRQVYRRCVFDRAQPMASELVVYGASTILKTDCSCCCRPMTAQTKFTRKTY